MVGKMAPVNLVGRPASAAARVFFFPAGFEISIEIPHAGGSGGPGRGVASAAPPSARQKDQTRRTGPSAVVRLGVGSLPHARAAPRRRACWRCQPRRRAPGRRRAGGTRTPPRRDCEVWAQTKERYV